MGRGDKKTAKGKRFKGSFGKTRPANTLAKKKAAKKAAAKLRNLFAPVLIVFIKSIP